MWLGASGGQVDEPPGGAEVAELAGRIGKAALAERSRIEALFVSRQVWSSAAFWRTYVEHPVSGWFGRQLLWACTTASGARLVGVPGAAGRDELQTLNWRPGSRERRRHGPALAPDRS